MFPGAACVGAALAVVLAACADDARAMGFSKEDFRHPPPEFTPSFFWMWGGKLTADNLLAEMDDMAARGVKSACIHPYPKAFRPKAIDVPMDPDFLTDGYFDLYGKVLDRIAEHGGTSWLYDEGGWPSGGACGRVYASDPKRFVPRMLGAGGRVVELKPNPEVTSPMPSVIEPGATERFIELAYEPYRARFSRHFGKTIRFAFTDEPGYPNNRRGGTLLPWCTDFADRFRERKGYDLSPFHDDLLAWTNRTEEVVRARIDYYDVLSSLLRERYFLAIRDWCRRNGLMFGGHLDNDDTPIGNATANYGHALRCLRTMDVPGVDVIWRQLFPGKDGRQVPFTKYASSAAHQNGGRYVVSETCAIYGHGLTPAQMKWLVDYQCLRGANLFVFSSYRARPSGKEMGTPGPCFGPVDPQWPIMGVFFRSLARQCALLAQGSPCVRIAVLYDIRGIWACGDEAAETVARHEDAARRLLEGQRDFDFVDDDQIAEAQILPDGSLGIGAMRYDAVVLPTSRRMLSAARRKLADFAARGGRVVENGDFSALPKVCEVFGADAGDIRAAKRRCGGETLYFLVNESESPRRVRVRLAETAPLARADPESGRFVAWPSSGGEFEWNAPGCGSLLLVAGATADDPAPNVPTGPVVTIEKGWKMAIESRLAAGPSTLEMVKCDNTPALDTKLGDWRDLLGEEFSGRVAYRAAFDSPAAGAAELDLGEVHNCCSVRLNGEDLGAKYAGPYRWRATLRRGINKLEVTVANAPVNALAPPHFRRYVAAAFPPESAYEKRVRKFNESGHESGLYGPVRVTLGDGCALPGNGNSGSGK